MPRKFLTNTGVAVLAITAEKMREVDRIAIEEAGSNTYQLMENAGRNLASVAIEELGTRCRAAKVVVLAGSCGNEGGGICVARYLNNRGIDLYLCLPASGKLRPLPAWQLRIFNETTGREVDVADLSKLEAQLILDALVGYSLRDALTGNTARVIRWTNAIGAPIVSFDVPSGVGATTGETAREFARASTTVTLVLPKTGLRRELAGRLLLADIAIPAGTYQRAGIEFTSPFGELSCVPLTGLEE